jgi:hypothetical protein
MAASQGEVNFMELVWYLLVALAIKIIFLTTLDICGTLLFTVGL